MDFKLKDTNYVLLKHIPNNFQQNWSFSSQIFFGSSELKVTVFDIFDRKKLIFKCSYLENGKRKIDFCKKAVES